MRSGRVEAFSDGVLAILITIMVLELRPPEGTGLDDLRHLGPVFASYVLSFVNLGIYWNNHHHLLQATKRVNGLILWANLHLLFWLSLFPFTTSWMGERSFAQVPVATYGVVALLAAVAYYLLQTAIVREHGLDSDLAAALGSDLKGKASPGLYILGILISSVSRWVGLAIYVAVAVMWLVPDRRLVPVVERDEHDVDRTGSEADPA
jgi:uncharacterized membrane protein